MSIAVVTGSSGGIGSEICLSLSKSGYVVIGLDSNPNSENTSIVCDVGEPGFSSKIPALDFGAVSLIVHCAAEQPTTPVAEVSTETWERTFRVNVQAAGELTSRFLTQLRDTNGTVIVISSVHALETSPLLSVYAASKAALESWVRSAAIELGPRVSVVGLAPGAIDTAKLREGLLRYSEDERKSKLQYLIDRTPAGRLGSASEIAAWVSFLASPAGKFATGSTITLDGGVSSRLASE